MNRFVMMAALLAAAALAGCTGELNVGDFVSACEKNSDCGPGFRCDRTAGCVAVQAVPDGGHDAGGSHDGGVFLRYSSTYESAAGVCVSPARDRILTSATGWSTGPRSGGPPTVQPGQPWGRK